MNDGDDYDYWHWVCTWSGVNIDLMNDLQGYDYWDWVCTAV